MMAATCNPANDDLFGPIIHGCRSNFDFTLLFEQSILSIPPAALLLLLAPPRLVRLVRSRRKTNPNIIRSLKSITALSLTGIQLALLITWTSRQVTRATVPAAILSFGASVAVIALSWFEHNKAIRPSTLLNLYLLFSIIFDVVQVRTLYLRHDDSAILGLFTASISIKTILLLLEARTKRGYLKHPYNKFSPETTSGIFNHSFFWWLSPVLTTGFKNILTVNDLVATDQELLSESLQNQMQSSWNKYASSGKFALVYAILHCLRWSLASMIFPRLCLVAFNYAQPFLISSAISYVSRPSPNKNDGYGLIAATGLVYLGIAISTAHFEYRRARLLTMFRGAMVSLIYSRSLDVQAGVHDDSATLTSTSTDVAALTTSLQALCDIWARVIEMSIGIWLLEKQLGWVCVAPLVIVAGCVYASSWVTKFIGPRRKVWTKAIQRRVGITSSMLGSMKSVKMMGLSNVLFDTIQGQRIHELNSSKEYRVMALWRLVLSYIPNIFGPFVTFVIFAIISTAKGSSRLSEGKTFSSLSIISLLTSPASQFLESLPLIGMSTSGLQRIQAFLRNSSHEDQRKSDYTTSENSSSNEPTNNSISLKNIGSNSARNGIKVEDISVRPAAEAPLALQNISFRAHQGSLTMVIGVVGSGKSTLLKALAGELKIEGGSIEVASKYMAYCAQTPWLQNATVRQIICGPTEEVNEDRGWYDTVVYACALDEDILQLPNHNDTIIGSRGVTLSGGQKQRLALARAVYARREVVILDDVLSAIDVKTESLIVDRLFSTSGIFKNLGFTVILATHAIRNLPLADNIIVLDSSGCISEQGSFASLRQKDGFVSKVILHPELLEHGQSETSSESTQKGPLVPKSLQGPSANDVADRTRRIGDVSVYKYYLAPTGWKLGSWSVVLLALYTVTLKFPPLWLTWYADGTVKSVALFSMIYAASSVLALLSIGTTLWLLFMRITPKSGNGLHKTLLRSVMRAPQSFFDQTDSGITLNRFSQDMTLISGPLPSSSISTLATLFQFLAQMALVSIGSSYMAVTCPALILTVYFLQNFYLRTSRQLRFLDLECQSPLFTHFAETLEGLSTIRTFGWQGAFMKVNLERLDTSQKPYYLLYCIQRWLGLVLQLIIAAMAVTVMALATSLTSTTSGGKLGVSLSQIVTFNSSLGSLLTAWTMMETSLGAIARLKSFQEVTKSEDKPEELLNPSEGWPNNGTIEFKNISASYGPNSPALRDISFTITAGSKIGVCGRTGSGKSSLLSVLLRILDLDSGTITIDSIDLSLIPRETIRSRIIAIPQEPFILAGSVRLNADPTSTASDDAIIEALKRVKLWDVLEGRGGLDAEMMNNQLSQGQGQIFCLARAMLRTRNWNGEGKGVANGNGILVLDEATSNVDAETDRLIQRLIREEFSGYTIITVAHRLDTIRDSDWIAVLEEGRLVEWGRPEEVLGRNFR